MEEGREGRERKERRSVNDSMDRRREEGREKK